MKCPTYVLRLVTFFIERVPSRGKFNVISRNKDVPCQLMKFTRTFRHGDRAMPGDRIVGCRRLWPSLNDPNCLIGTGGTGKFRRLPRDAAVPRHFRICVRPRWLAYAIELGRVSECGASAGPNLFTVRGLLEGTLCIPSTMNGQFEFRLI